MFDKIEQLIPFLIVQIQCSFIHSKQNSCKNDLHCLNNIKIECLHFIFPFFFNLRR